MTRVSTGQRLPTVPWAQRTRPRADAPQATERARYAKKAQGVGRSRGPDTVDLPGAKGTSELRGKGDLYREGIYSLAPAGSDLEQRRTLSKLIGVRGTVLSWEEINRELPGAMRKQTLAYLTGLRPGISATELEAALRDPRLEPIRLFHARQMRMNHPETASWDEIGAAIYLAATNGASATQVPARLRAFDEYRRAFASSAIGRDNLVSWNELYGMLPEVAKLETLASLVGLPRSFRGEQLVQELSDPGNAGLSAYHARALGMENPDQVSWDALWSRILELAVPGILNANSSHGLIIIKDLPKRLASLDAQWRSAATAAVGRPGVWMSWREIFEEPARAVLARLAGMPGDLPLRKVLARIHDPRYAEALRFQAQLMGLQSPDLLSRWRAVVSYALTASKGLDGFKAFDASLRAKAAADLGRPGADLSWNELYALKARFGILAALVGLPFDAPLSSLMDRAQDPTYQKLRVYLATQLRAPDPERASWGAIAESFFLQATRGVDDGRVLGCARAQADRVQSLLRSRQQKLGLPVTNDFRSLAEAQGAAAP